MVATLAGASRPSEDTAQVQAMEAQQVDTAAALVATVATGPVAVMAEHRAAFRDTQSRRLVSTRQAGIAARRSSALLDPVVALEALGSLALAQGATAAKEELPAPDSLE